MSVRKEREKTIEHGGAVRIKFEGTPPSVDAPDVDIGGSKSPRGRAALRSSNNGTNSGGGVMFKLALPSTKEGGSAGASSANTSPSSSSSSASKSSVFTPRSMLNKVKHTLSMANSAEVDLPHAVEKNVDPSDEKGKGGEKDKPGRPSHKRSRSMGDAKAALQPLREGGAPQGGAPGSPGGRSGSVVKRKGSTAGGSFLSFSSAKLKSSGDLSSGDSGERASEYQQQHSTAASADAPSADQSEEADDLVDTAGDAEPKEGDGTAGPAQQRKKWGSLQRRNNSLVIKKSSTADGLATTLTKRNTIISEASGNRMDRAQRRRYRILVSSPRGGSGGGGAAGDEAGGEGELDPEAAEAEDFDSDSDDWAEDPIHPVGEERKRSHTLAAGAKGLLKTPRFFQKDVREKRTGNLPQGDSDPGISFRPGDERRHRRTNSTDIGIIVPEATSGEDTHLKAVHLRYKEMEDLQLGGRERRERNKRLSVHVEQVLSNRPSYDSLVYRGILKEWNEPSHRTLQDFPSHLPPLVWSVGNNTEGKTEGWNVERGAARDFVVGAHSALEDEGYVPFFETHFYKAEYTTWWGVDDKFGPIIICIQKQPVSAGEADCETAQSGGYGGSGSFSLGAGAGAEPSVALSSSDTGVPTASASGPFGAGAILRRLGEKATGGGKPASGLLSLYRVLIQSKKGGKQLFIRSTEKSQEKLKALKTALGSQGYLTEVAFSDIKFKKLKDLDIREDLLYLEKKFFSTDYKFGVLYAKKGQNENQMFSNLASETSPEFEQFLALMGEKVTLKAFKGYTGGLDIKTDTTGLESVYTEFRNQRIMYHVSTLLPFFPRDEQQVERKRHLGNDIVVIIYQEPGAQFDPTPMKTQFNHIYCVVCAEKREGESAKTRVRVEFAVKQGVRPFGPPLPDPSDTHFQLDYNLREFLLSKLVNSERAALKAPAFATKMEKTRRIFIEQLIDSKIKK